MHHIIPQAPCLVTADDEWAADYVVRTEHLEEDMRQVRVRTAGVGLVSGWSWLLWPLSPWIQPLFPLGLLSLLLQSCRCS